MDWTNAFREETQKRCTDLAKDGAIVSYYASIPPTSFITKTVLEVAPSSLAQRLVL